MKMDKSAANSRYVVSSRGVFFFIKRARIIEGVLKNVIAFSACGSVSVGLLNGAFNRHATRWNSILKISADANDKVSMTG